MVIARIRQVCKHCGLLAVNKMLVHHFVLMLCMGPLQLVDRLSVKAIFNRLDKRKLQNELDTHRLYLVTSHFDRLKAGVCQVEV